MTHWFTEIWRYREFVLGSVRRNFDLTYRNSALGAIWTVLNPLAMIFVYTVVFSQVMRAKLPGVDSVFGYSIYLCSGVLVWGLFVEIASQAKSVFVDHANLMKKVRFPKGCLPLIVLLNAFLNFSIIFGLFLGFLVVTGNFPGRVILDLIPLLGLLAAFALALGLSVGVINVFFRDAGHLFGVALTLWFWLTPIVYPLNIVPEHFRMFIALNPISAVFEGVQNVLVRQVSPDWSALQPTLGLTFLLLLVAALLYRRFASEMVDEL